MEEKKNLVQYKFILFVDFVRTILTKIITLYILFCSFRNLRACWVSMVLYKLVFLLKVRMSRFLTRVTREPCNSRADV